VLTLHLSLSWGLLVQTMLALACCIAAVLSLFDDLKGQLYQAWSTSPSLFVNRTLDL